MMYFFQSIYILEKPRTPYKVAYSHQDNSLIPGEVNFIASTGQLYVRKAITCKNLGEHKKWVAMVQLTAWKSMMYILL